MATFSVKIKNYKCFKDETGFDDVKRVNLIVGKNNAGKSSLLDLIEYVANKNYQFDRATWRAGQVPQITFHSEISADAVAKTFSSNYSGGPIHGNHGEYGRRLMGRAIVWSKSGQGRDQTRLISCDDNGVNPPLINCADYVHRLPSNMEIPLEGKSFRRVLAERDIVPEVDSAAVKILPNGVGVTNAIQNFINRSSLPSEVVEVDILNALNEIFAHDAKFSDIVCQLHESNLWEIYLEEENKGRIALSKSGSGLKTVITVLSCLFLIPRLESSSLDNYIFGFEELENNIHPALLRRLNDYIYRTSIKSNFVYFITTHSNVLIDQFGKQEDAQILHVKQKDAQSQCVAVKTYVENNGILDDLDVRASDLLQANGIVWVEGPSDRVYINRWIGLWSDGLLREGTHYQVVFYGGRLLSHLSAELPGVVEDGISILNANRNAIIVMDSDKRNQQTRINDTKQRIQNEFERLGAVSWMSKGREVENYISNNVVDKFWKLEKSAQVEQYGSFFDYVDSLVPGDGAKYANKKPLLAEQLIQFMTIDNMRQVLDLDERMKVVCARIKGWNS